MLEQWPERARRAGSLLASIAAMALIGLVYYLGIRSERTGFVRDVLDPGFRSLSDPVLDVFRDKPPPVAIVSVQLDSASLDSLLDLQRIALQHGRVQREGNTLFAATVRLGERSIPAVVGLREGVPLQARERSWPLHVRFLPGDSILGMQTFDLVRVRNEVPLWSFLFNSLLNDLGHAVLGQALAEVDLNGKNLGLCMLQGRVDDIALARWGKGNGPVLRFDDDMLQDVREEMKDRKFPSTPPRQGDWMSAPLLLHSSQGARVAGRAQRAVRRMEAFRAGDLPASELFDAACAARTLALGDLLGTQSAMDWWNLRFLLDSASEKLILVPLHLSTRSPITELQAEQLPETSGAFAAGKELAGRLLLDTAIHARYIAYLDSFSATGWWEAARDRTEHGWLPARKVINAEFPSIDLDLDVVEHDRTVIRQTLVPTNVVLAYVRDGQDQADGIALANVHSLAVEVLGIILNEGDTAYLPSPLRLPPRKKERPLHYIVVPLSILRKQGAPKAVLVRLAPSLPARQVPIRSWSTFGAN